MFKQPALVEHVDELYFMNISGYCGFYSFQKTQQIILYQNAQCIVFVKLNVFLCKLKPMFCYFFILNINSHVFMCCLTVIPIEYANANDYYSHAQ